MLHIETDTTPEGGRDDDALVAFLEEKWKPKDATPVTPAPEGATPTEPEGEPEPSEPTEGHGEGEPSDPPAPVEEDLADDRTVSVGDRKISIGELRALAQRDTEIEQQRVATQQAHEEVLRIRQEHLDGLRQVAEGAKARWDEFARLDIEEIRRNASPQEWDQFSGAARQAYEQFQAAQDRLTQLEPHVMQAAQEKRQQAAQECVRSLTDPKTGIPGYSVERNQKGVEFAKTLGVSNDYLNSLTDPAAWRLIDMALRYHEAQSQAKAAKPVTKVPATGKPAHTAQSSTTSGDAAKKAAQRLRQSGSDDDAIALLMARMA